MLTFALPFHWRNCGTTARATPRMHYITCQTMHTHTLNLRLRRGPHCYAALLNLNLLTCV